MRKNPLIARLMVVVVWLAGIQLAAAQNIIRIGEWRSHLPYTRGLSVTQSPTKVFYGTDRAFFSVDKDSLDDIRFYSKIDGLSDVGVRQVKYQAANDVLIVIYNNSNIDLVFQGGIVNIDDIVQNNTIIGSKVINDVWVGDTDFIYLSCDFGLVEFNVMTGKFGFTMFTNTPVRAFTQYSGGFYIATDSGIYFFDNFSTELVSNFDAWERMGSDFGLPDDYQAQGVTVYQGELFAAADHVLYNFDQGDFMPWDMIDGREITFLSPEGQFLMVGFNCPNASCNGTVNFYDTEGQVAKEGFQCTGITQYAIGDEDGRIWYADRFEGIRYANDYTFGCERLDYDTPFSSNVSEIAIKENTVYVAAGGVTDRYNNLNRPDGFFTLKGRDWSFQNRTNNEQLAAEDPLDYFRIAPHPDPDSPLVYIGTYFSGLIRFNTADSIYTFYDQNNSALQGAVGDDLRERVAGMAFDREGNLWMSNYLAPRPIVVLEKDGTWRNFSVPGPTELGEVVIDQRGYKWFAIISSSAGLLVYDDNRTIDNPSDDRYRVLRTSNSNLPTNSLTNLTVDQGGDIWVGTSLGPVVFDGAQDPFTGDNQGFRVIVEQDGVLDFLLGEEQINTIAVDGANQKWIGTQNGVFVQSPSGEEEVARYTVDNSPLLDNVIIDIAINPEDGEVFIGTASGLISTRAEATEGESFHNQNAYAFPNPVRPDYEGPIAIKGLAENAAVKITNVAGTVVYETRALGGQAIWNGKDPDGRRAESGVYLVFSTTESQFDKPDAIVTKILLVN